MNKKDLEELKKRKEYEDEQKLMNKIHANYRAANDEYKMNKQLKQIAAQEKKKKEKRTNKLCALGLVVLLIGSIFVLNLVNQDFINDCVESGNSQYFCEKHM